MWLFNICVVKDIFEFEYRWSLLLWLNALAIAGARRGTFGEKHHTELGFEYLKRRRKYHKLCCFSKFFKDQPPRYLFVIPSVKTTYIARNDDKLPHFKVKHNYFNIFLSYWKKKSRHKKSSMKNCVTGKIIRHFLPTNFLPGCLKTIELKWH